MNERTAPSSRLLLFKQDQLFIDLFNRADPKPSQCSVISSVTDTALKRQSTLLSVATRGQSGNGFGSLSCVCVCVFQLLETGEKIIKVNPSMN